MTHDPEPQWVTDVMRELMDDNNIDAYGIDPWEVGPVLLAMAGLGYKLTRIDTEEPEYCPCRWTCHSTPNPCSISCLAHHHMPFDTEEHQA